MKSFTAAVVAVLVLCASVIQIAQAPDDLDKLCRPDRPLSGRAPRSDAALGREPGEDQRAQRVAAQPRVAQGHAAPGRGAKARASATAIVALVLFPQVVNTMAEQIDWTTKLGKAFTADRAAVFASIQRLRTQAKDAGQAQKHAQQAVDDRDHAVPASRSS